MEREVSENSLVRYHAELYERYVDRIEAHKPVLSPDSIYVTAEDFSAKLDRFPHIHVEELAITEGADSPDLSFLPDHTEISRKYPGAYCRYKEVSRSRENTLLFILSNLGRAERITIF